MRRIKFLSLLLALILFIAGCSDKTKDNNDQTKDKKNDKEHIELTVSAAVSLTDALEEIEDVYGKENNVQFKFNLGSSGTLTQQIEQGAPVDVFISANTEWMDTLEESNHIKEGTRKDVTGNRIVLIGPKESKDMKITDITKDNSGQIAIGNPESVPAGKYTEEILKNLDKWTELESNFVMAKDVRQVLTYVETGNAEIGFVYESDASISDKTKILDVVDTSLHEPIIYPAAVIENSKQAEAAEKFIEYVESKEGQKILEKYGFVK